MKKRWVGLVDCNNFFVSCERLFRPELEGKPVMVLSSNDGCVVARSQEVKDMDVLMGVPYFKIKDIAEKRGIVSFSSHFALYRDISRRVFQVMREVTPNMQQYSVDEAFFYTYDDDPTAFAESIKNAIETKVGIPVSVGVSRTKTQAKHASKLAKKNGGLCVLNQADWDTLAPDIMLPEIWGVGGGMEMKLKGIGAVTVADFMAIDPMIIKSNLGVVGLRLHDQFSGIDGGVDIVQGREKKQSMTSSRSFKDSVESLEALKDAVAYHVRKVAEDMRENELKTLSIRVELRTSRYGDFLLRGGSKEATLTLPTNDTITLIKHASKLTDELYEPGVPYKKAGVLLGQLVDDLGQGSLFDEDDTDTPELMQVIDKVNGVTNIDMIQIGSRLMGKTWGTGKAKRSPAYTTDWNDLKNVKAG